MEGPTSLQIFFGCAWLPTLIVLFVGYLYWRHRKYTRHNSRMPSISDVQNGEENQMKKLLTIALVLLLTTMVDVATAGSKKDVARYEVKVEIVYNSLTPDEMGRVVMEEIGEDHAGACTVKFNVKKLRPSDDTITWNTGTNTIFLDDSNTVCFDDNGNLVPCDN